MHVEYTAGVWEAVECVSNAIFLGWVKATYGGDVWFECSLLLSSRRRLGVVH